MAPNIWHPKCNRNDIILSSFLGDHVPLKIGYMLGIRRSVVLMTLLYLFTILTMFKTDLWISLIIISSIFFIFEASRPSSTRLCLWGCLKSSCGHMLCRESRSHFKPSCLPLSPRSHEVENGCKVWKVANYYWRHLVSVFHFYIWLLWLWEKGYLYDPLSLLKRPIELFCFEATNPKVHLKNNMTDAPKRQGSLHIFFSNVNRRHEKTEVECVGWQKPHLCNFKCVHSWALYLDAMHIRKACQKLKPGKLQKTE